MTDLPVPTRYFDDLPLTEADFDRISAEAAATAAAATTPPAVTPPVTAQQIASQGGRGRGGSPPPAAAAAVTITKEEQKRIKQRVNEVVDRRFLQVRENQRVIYRGL